MIRIIGVDPGTRYLGLACLDWHHHQKVKVVSALTLKAPQKEKVIHRLQWLSGPIKKFFVESQAQELAIEDIFLQKNIKSAFQLGLVRGMILAEAFHQKLKIAEYPPRVVKNAVVGYGQASKEQVRKMVELQIGINCQDQPDDTTDALAIALCHGFHVKGRVLTHYSPPPQG